MNTAIIGLLAETPIHPGCGRNVGVLDLPVAREAATDYPVLVGSSLKGALRDRAECINKASLQGTTPISLDDRFGRPDAAGDLLISDGRLLLLPVRSLTGSFRWVTCPQVVERLIRDLARAQITPRPIVPAVKNGEVLTKGSGMLFLEERQFSISGPASADLLDAMNMLLLHKEAQGRLPEQLAVLSNDDFAWFARYGLPVQARNVLADDGSKKSKNLWYEETLPPDTVMYSVVLGRDATAIHTLDTLFPVTDPYLQVGGNETVGQGWFAVKVSKSDGAARTAA